MESVACYLLHLRQPAAVFHKPGMSSTLFLVICFVVLTHGAMVSNNIMLCCPECCWQQGAHAVVQASLAQPYSHWSLRLTTENCT